jgi:hypothetical protein
MTAGIATEVKYVEGATLPVELSAEEAEAYMKKATALAELLKDTQVTAKYKLEVAFGRNRTVSGLTPGLLSFWASGSRFHGGGDDKIYLCPAYWTGKSTCRAPILESYLGGGTAVCPACGTVWAVKDLVGEVCLNLPMRKWADALYLYFRHFEYDCDLYMKPAKDDIRARSLAQVQRQTWAGTQALDKLREERLRVIYPLRNIVRETRAGASLLGRIYAFLTA